jgi:hypothetical protein
MVSNRIKIIMRKTLYTTALLLIVNFLFGCDPQFGTSGGSSLTSTTDLGPTIGSVAEVVIPEAVLLEGYGLVGELMGTGSSECPTNIRKYLTQEILRQLPAQKTMDVERFINSNETAVVLVEGILPSLASKGQSFDVKVTALPGTQTTSLEGGRLYSTELKLAGTFGLSTRILAGAEGPLYVDEISNSPVDKRTGYVLGGAKALDEQKVGLIFHKADFATTNNVRNRLNERFGSGTANAVMPGRIEVTIPYKYRDQKQRFISIIKAMYFTWGPQIDKERIKTFVSRLAASRDGYESEVALEAIGNESLSKLRVLLNLSDEQVRLRAARCMLFLGDNEAFDTLRQIAMNPGSTNRTEALEAIADGADRRDAAFIARRLLRDNDFKIRLLAYKILRKLDDIAVEGEAIADDFYLERISQIGHRAIYVSRSDTPSIVLFDAPIYCVGNIFIQSKNSDITINAPSGAEYVTLLRRYPSRPGKVGQSKSSFVLSDIIRTLCEEPAKEGQREPGGLGVSYDQMAALLQQMCDKGAVRAEFHAGPLPKIGLNVKK